MNQPATIGIVAGVVALAAFAFFAMGGSASSRAYEASNNGETTIGGTRRRHNKHNKSKRK